MTGWLKFVDKIFDAVFVKYTVRISVFLLVLVAVNALLKSSIFQWINKLDIPVFGDFSIPSSFPISVGIALITQAIVSELLLRFQTWLNQRDFTKDLEEQILPNEAALLFALHEAGITTIRANDRERLAEGPFFCDQSEVSLALRRLSNTAFLTHVQYSIESYYMVNIYAIRENFSQIKSMAKPALEEKIPDIDI